MSSRDGSYLSRCYWDHFVLILVLVSSYFSVFCCEANAVHGQIDFVYSDGHNTWIRGWTCDGSDSPVPSNLRVYALDHTNTPVFIGSGTETNGTYIFRVPRFSTRSVCGANGAEKSGFIFSLNGANAGVYKHIQNGGRVGIATNGSWIGGSWCHPSLPADTPGRVVRQQPRSGASCSMNSASNLFTGTSIKEVLYWAGMDLGQGHRYTNVYLEPSRVYVADSPVRIKKSDVKLSTVGEPSCFAGGRLTGQCATIKAATTLNFAVMPASFNPITDIDNWQGINTNEHDAEGWSNGLLGIGNASKKQTIHNVKLKAFVLDGNRVERSRYAVSRFGTFKFGSAVQTSRERWRVCYDRNCGNIYMSNCQNCSIERIASVSPTPVDVGSISNDAYGHLILNSHNLLVRDSLFLGDGSLSYWMNNFAISNDEQDSRMKVTVSGNTIINGNNGTMTFHAFNGAKMFGLVENNYVAVPGTGSVHALVALFNVQFKDSNNIWHRGRFGSSVVDDPNVTLVIRNNTIDCQYAGTRGCLAGISMGLEMFPLGNELFRKRSS